MTGIYRGFDFTEEFLESFGDKSFTGKERKQLLKALRLLNENERHPSLRVHELRGDLAGIWSASASKNLRITFKRIADGRKRLLSCTHHYAD